MTKPVGEAQAPEKEEQKLEPKPQPKFDAWSKEERESSKQKYCCEILVSNGTLEDVNTTQAPNDALIITYTINQNKHLDLTRGPRTKVFDMYWDKFKSGLKSIDYGNGKISPKLWGYQSTPSRKKKRK
tara:strand:- start:1203 stop:1586 length:384 start_codon:yes stop_codon:yes gene_type:complete